MTREEALKLWLPIIKQGVSDGRMPECAEALDMAIKALEKEPCEDCISREAVMKLLNDGWWKGVYPSGAIVALPPVTPQQSRWIPVSERLPEVGSEVLVCYEFKGKRSVYIADFYGDGEFHGLDDEYLTADGRKYRKAIAWKPLPEPYKQEVEK